MATKKVVLNGETLIDLTLDTIAPEYVVKGKTFHGRDGEIYSGTYSGGSDVELNVAYGEQPPTDTSKLWIKTDKPVYKVVTGEVDYAEGGIETIGSLLQPIDSVSCATVGEKAYLFGGRAQSNAYSSDIQSFDLNTHKTSAAGSIASIYPNGVYGLSCAAIGEKIYGFGGRIRTSPNYSRAAFCFDTKAGTVTLLSSTLLPNALHYMGCAAVGTKIYLFGGTGSSRSDAIYCFDTETTKCTRLPIALPQPIYAMGCIAIERKIYLFGGVAPGTSPGRSNSILCFDTDKGTLEELSIKLPVRPSNVACGVIGTKIYIFGGYIYSDNENYSNGYSDIIISFDFETKEVEVLEQTLPSSMESMGYVSAVQGIYLFGGKTGTRFDTIILFQKSEAEFLESGTLDIVGINGEKFFIVNTESARIVASVSKVYYGNESNAAELVDAALYKDGEWKNIY